MTETTSDSKKSLLDYLRSKGSLIDCDTLDTTIAKELGPFEDCTSNQAIVWGELQANTEKHKNLVLKSCKYAVWELENLRQKTNSPELTAEQLAVEVITISLGHLIAPYLRRELPSSRPHHLHIQVNPTLTNNTEATIAASYRLQLLYEALCPIQPFPTASYPVLSIKIPASYPALEAARVLESDKYNIRTLATMVLSLPQVKLAGESGCSYAAVYVNNLGVHFPEELEKLKVRRGVSEISEEEVAKSMDIVRLGQEWLHRNCVKETGDYTVMMPASLTTITECLQLAGADHITIPPSLLYSLSETEWTSESSIPDSAILRKALTDELVYSSLEYDDNKKIYLTNQDVFETDFSDAGKTEDYSEAVRIFSDFQAKLEELALRVLVTEGLLIQPLPVN